MIKKAFILFVVALLSEMLFVGCLFCNSKEYRSDLTGLNFQIFKMDTVDCYTNTQDSLICNYTTKVVYEKDSIILSKEKFEMIFSIETSYKSASFIPTFSSQAYACDVVEYVKLSIPIKKFEMRCNHDILNTKAGELIDNDKILLDRSSYYGKKDSLSVNKWIELANNKDGQGLFNYEFFTLKFTEPIISDEYLTFEISVILEDGKKFSTTNVPIKIVQ